MRFHLSLVAAKGQATVMPINYQYPFGSWIYKKIGQHDPIFSEWLHNNGYSDGVRSFKLFSFSRLMVRGAKPEPVNRLRFADAPIQVEVGFYLDEVFRPFLMGLFDNTDGQLVDRFGGIDFRVEAISRVPDPIWAETMSFETLSPVHVDLKMDDGRTKYLRPDDSAYETALFNNLVHKYQAAHPTQPMEFERASFRFDLRSEPRKRQIIIREHQPDATNKIAYDFVCRISAPIELMRIAYATGLGKANNQGFGLLRAK